jgi:hypothetical protein
VRLSKSGKLFNLKQTFFVKINIIVFGAYCSKNLFQLIQSRGIMKKKFTKLFVGAVTLMCITFAVSAQKRVARNVKTVETITTLANSLPASDAVFHIDVKRMFDVALPQILASKPEEFAKMNTKIDEIRAKTGIDVRLFEKIAVGIAIKQVDKKTNLEPIVLAQGKFNSNALIALAKVASKGKYREEKIGERTVYVFNAKEVIEENAPKAKASMFDKVLAMFANEMAVTAFDDNTLTLGSLVRVKEMLDGKSKVDANVLALVNKKSNAIASFAASTPSGMSQFIDLDNDELGNILASIRTMNGSLDMGEGSATLAISAKTVNIEQATSMEETLVGLQMVGKTLLGGMKSEKKQILGKMIDKVEIKRKTNTVNLGLQIPQSDIDVLIGAVM